MGFDFVDKKFRPKEPIRLECQCCEKPGPTVVYRQGEGVVLCDDCYNEWSKQQPDFWPA